MSSVAFGVPFSSPFSELLLFPMGIFPCCIVGLLRWVWALSRGFVCGISFPRGLFFFLKKAFTREFLTLVSFGLWALRVSFLAGSSSYVLSVAFAGA